MTRARTPAPVLLAAASNSAPISPTAVAVFTVAITPEQMPVVRALIAEAVAEAMNAQQSLPDWMDQEAMAAHLAVSSPTVRKLAEVDGMPYVLAGSHKRFSRRECDAWLRARGVASRVAEAAE